MKKFALLAALVGSALVSSQAMATTYHMFTGTECKAVSPGDQASLFYNGWGVANVSTTKNIAVQCPLSTQYNASSPPAVTQVGIWGYDRNPSSDISCSIQNWAHTAGINWSVSVSTSGYASDVKQAYANISASEHGWLIANCTIPAQNSVGTSHLVNLWLVTSE